jgi:hypothetical protein
MENKLPMQTMDKYPVPLPGVVGRVVEHEAVLVLPDKGQVKVLNELGARIWELANGARSVREIVQHICDEYAVDLDVAQEDTLEFLSDLEEKGVIRLSDQPN